MIEPMALMGVVAGAEGMRDFHCLGAEGIFAAFGGLNFALRRGSFVGFGGFVVFVFWKAAKAFGIVFLSVGFWTRVSRVGFCARLANGNFEAAITTTY
jgi:hypothetical protein